jgi:hypothetical protein
MKRFGYFINHKFYQNNLPSMGNASDAKDLQEEVRIPRNE